jgi:membrane protease YdiL (CAAX protease family)
MTTTALAVVLAVLVIVNVWVHLGPPRAHIVTGPLAALALLLVSRAAGLSWAELGLSREALLSGLLYGSTAAGAMAVVYAVGVAVPFTRRAFRDTRYRMPMRSAVLLSLVTIPLATVIFEEVAFRSVLWGLLRQENGARVATVVSSALFGLWHVLPAMDVAQTSTAIRGTGELVERRRVVVTVLGTVLFTAFAGVIFAELRRRSGSVVAPLALHWATNGLAVVAAARVWAISPPPPSSSAPSSG